MPSPGCADVARARRRHLLVGVGRVQIATHGRVHVKPPFVERFTQTPLVSSVRLKLIWA